MDLSTLRERDGISWTMYGCFHNPPCIQVETKDNLVRKPSMHGCMHHFQFQHTHSQLFRHPHTKSRAPGLAMVPRRHHSTFSKQTSALHASSPLFHSLSVSGTRVVEKSM